MKRMYVMIAAAALCIVGVTGAAANDRVQASAAVTAQKLTFLERLITDSVASRTIEESGDLAAIAKLEEARRLVEDAKSMLSDDQFEQADANLDRALHLINDEARRLSVADIKAERAAEAFRRRRHTVDIFLSARDRVVDARENGDAATRAKLIRKLIEEADAYKLKGEFEKGVAILDRAYEIARNDIREARDGQELVRSLVFETPRDAYEYELGRARSHFLLLQFALEEKNPQGSVRQAIQKDRKAAEALRKQAIAKAEKGGYVAAIGDLEAATEILLKAIRMSGVYIPG